MKAGVNLYEQDILLQTEAVRIAINRLNPLDYIGLKKSIQSGDYDRILLTGMGASYFGLYPANLILSASNLPVIWLDTAELIHYAQHLITNRTIIWIVSQSGRSAEVLALLEKLNQQVIGLLLVTCNDLNSPLAKQADLVVNIDAKPEKTVSTRTYLNTVALTQLISRFLIGDDYHLVLSELEEKILRMQEYLEGWEHHLLAITKQVGNPLHLVVLGRGPSLASALVGALVLQEAAKYPAFGMQAAEFRHGPLEIAGPEVSVLLFAGDRQTRVLNRRLYDDLIRCGAQAFWLAPDKEEGENIPVERLLPMPATAGIGLPLGEILPIQLLSLHLARANGFEPGEFLHIGKVTHVQ